MVANFVYPFHIHIQFHNSSNYFFFVYFPLFICLQLWLDFHLHQVIPKVFMVANVVYPFQTRWPIYDIWSYVKFWLSVENKN